MTIRRVKNFIKKYLIKYLNNKTKYFTGLQREIYLRSTGDYDFWIRSIEEREEKTEGKPPLFYTPRISVLVPVYNVSSVLFKACVDSVLSQTYENFELVLCDDCSTLESVRPDMEAFARADARIKILFAEKNGGISKTTNMALSVATGEFVAFLDCDDVLRPNALYENIKLLNEDPSLDVIYSDEDKIDEAGTKRMYPYFKPDYSPDTLMSFNYFCHFVVMRRSIVNSVGGLRSEYDGAQDHDLILRVTEKTDKVAHISKILYHWRMRVGSTALNPDQKNYAMIAAEKMKQEAIKRRGFTGRVETVADVSRVVYDVKGEPKVSVIIPSKDHPEVLNTCISSFAEHTDYKNCELIVVDNGSSPENRAKYEKMLSDFGGRYIYEKEDFNFSRMCNRGAAAARGDYLLFLNDDVEIIEDKWLSVMLGAAGQAHAGAVGAKLMFPGNRLIQHDGVISITPGPCHMFYGQDDRDVFYVHQNRLDFNVLAVTAACLLVRRGIFEEVSGFNEDFPVAYNDVDLCFRIHKAGYKNIIRNDARLIHHESLSRGNDAEDHEKMKRLMAEWDKLYAIHPEYRGYDPYYNRHLHQFRGDFSLFTDMYADYSVMEAGQFYNEGPADDVGIIIDFCVLDWALQVRGRAKFRGNHNMEPVSLYIRGKEKSYIIKTDKIYKMEVAIRCPWSKDAAFSGFNAVVDRHLLAPDEYELFVLKNAIIYDTKVRFTKDY